MDAVREWMESDLDVIMLGPWMLCGNGWSLIWTLSCLSHGCSAGVNIGSDLDVIMVGTWMTAMDMVCSGRYHGWHMDALRQWIWSDMDVIMVGTWML